MGKKYTVHTKQLTTHTSIAVKVLAFGAVVRTDKNIDTKTSKIVTNKLALSPLGGIQ